MRFLRNRLLRRFSIFGRVADIAMVAGMAMRVAKRQGWIDSGEIDQFGIDPDVDDRRGGMIEMVLAGAALGRLVGRAVRRPKR